MAFIVEQFTSDRGIQLGHEALIRAMPWGANWNKIRVGCRVAVNGYAGINAPSGLPQYPPHPVLGFSQGPYSNISDDAVDVVFCAPLTVGQTSNWLGSAPANYYALANAVTSNIAFYQRSGATITQRNYNSAVLCFSANPTALRSAYYLTIEKSGSVLSVTLHAPNAAQVLIDYTRGDFLKGLENEAAPANLALVNIATTSSLVPSTRAYDYAFINWTKAVPTACFYDFSVVRFY